MTLLGKLLVFATVLLSFVMFSTAAALYTNRIDWSLTAPKDGKPAGVMVGRQERLKAASASLLLSESRWREARKGLRPWEDRRDTDRKWYDGELKAAREGPGGNPVEPIKWVLFKDGQPVFDDKGLPTMVPAERRKPKAEEGRPLEPGQPLYCNRYYLDDLVKLTQMIEMEQLRFQKLVKEETELTVKAIGPKGLRQRITDEHVKIGRVDEEYKDLTGRRTNSVVETELLLARREQMERRIEELKKAQPEK